MSPDSRVAERFTESLGQRRKKYEPRTRPPAAIVVHTTGYGPVRRYKSDPSRYGSPFNAALWLYAQAMQAGPHYVVGEHGECVQVTHESLCAWHVGGKGARPYRHASRYWTTARYGWWASRWGKDISPRDLAGGDLWRPYSKATSVKVALHSLAGSCNANTIGIEVVPPQLNARDPWSDQCWYTLAVLVEDIAYRHQIPVTRDRIITHSDAHPIARTAKGKPWDTDPAQFTWERFCDWTDRDPTTGDVREAA